METDGIHLQVLVKLINVIARPLVLSSARKGLIFTRSQEGTQPGGLTQPGQTEQGIPYHVPSCWVPAGGELGGKSVAAQEGAVAAGGESSFLCSAALFCVFSLSVSLLLLFPLFAVLLNCPYPDPPVSTCFFPFSSASQQGGRGGHVALLLPAAAKL